MSANTINGVINSIQVTEKAKYIPLILGGIFAVLYFANPVYLTLVTLTIVGIGCVRLLDEYTRYTKLKKE